MIALPFDDHLEFAEALYYAHTAAKLTRVENPHAEPRSPEWEEVSEDERSIWRLTARRLLQLHPTS
jgi:hypothetical protein